MVSVIMNMHLKEMYERPHGQSKRNIHIKYVGKNTRNIVFDLYKAGFISKIVEEFSDSILVAFYGDTFSYLRYDKVERRLNRSFNFDKELEAEIVYIMVDGTKMCKIGFTSEVRQRCRSLRCSNPSIKILRAYYGDYSLENKLHIRYSEKRIHGTEWFALNREDIKWMDEHLKRVPTELLPQSFIWKP